MPSAQRSPRLLQGEVPAITHAFREFQGMNVASPRQSIRDDQFSWLENYMPVAEGNLHAPPAATGLGTSYASKTLYTMSASINGNDYLIVFLADGSATYVTPAGVSVQAFPPGTFTAPYAIPYTSPAGRTGVLVIDPTGGYQDFNVTTNLATQNLGKAITSVAVGSSSVFAYASVQMAISGGSTTVSIQSNYIVKTLAITAGGTGYVVGDVLTITAGIFATPTIITVTTVSAGAITGVTFTPGSYTGPTNTTFVNVGFPGASAGVGGSGTGATFTGMFTISSYTILNPGGGYSSTPTVQDKTAGATLDSALVTISGATLGTSIASYAGRIWIANGKTVTFTDVNSYNGFGGAGGSFTVNESYWHKNINALYAANGYLYLFGDNNIDVLSNVQVSNGITTFSRVNITPSIGTSYPFSIGSYYRSIGFANNYGFYLLSGATPQKISDDLDGLFTSSVLVGNPVFGTATVYGILCACWLLRINDTFTTLYGTGTTRTLILTFFKGKWYVYYPGFDVAFLANISATTGVQTLYGAKNTANGTTLYSLFTNTSAAMIGYVQTKLWDGGAPLQDKEVLKVGVGLTFSSTLDRTLLVTTDNENLISPPVSIASKYSGSVTWVNDGGQGVTFQNSALGNVTFIPTIGNGTYFLGQGPSVTTAGKYFGMSVTTEQTGNTLLLMAMEYRATTMW